MGFRRKQSVILLFITNSILFFFQGMSKFIYTPLLSPFQETFAISSARAGLLITLVFMGYALARFPSGLLTDIIGCPRTIIYGSLATGAGLILVGISPTYPTMAVSTFLMGAATGLYVTAGYTFSVELGRDHMETVSTALMETFGGIAGLLSPLVVVLFLEVLDVSWSVLFFVMAAGVFVAVLLFLLTLLQSDLRQLYGENSGNSNSLQRNEINDGADGFSGREFLDRVKKALAVLKIPSLRVFLLWAIIVGGFGNFAPRGFESFIPTYLDEGAGFTFSQANQLFSLIALSGLFTKILVAWMADRFGSKNLLLAIYLINIVFFFVFTSTGSTMVLVVSLIIFGLTFRSHNTVINSYVLKESPPAHRGTLGFFHILHDDLQSGTGGKRLLRR